MEQKIKNNKLIAFIIIGVVVAVVIGFIGHYIFSAPSFNKVGDILNAKSYNLTVSEINKLEPNLIIGEIIEDVNYYEIVLEIENISEKELLITPLDNISCYIDGYILKEDLIAHSLSNYDIFYGSIPMNRKLKGSLCFNLPETWNVLEIDVSLDQGDKNNVQLKFENPLTKE